MRGGSAALVLTAPSPPSLCSRPQTLQEQQAARAQNLAELSTWLEAAEDTLAEQQRAASEGDLSTLQQRQSDVKVSASERGAGRLGGLGTALGALSASRHRAVACPGAAEKHAHPSRLLCQHPENHRGVLGGEQDKDGAWGTGGTAREASACQGAVPVPAGEDRDGPEGAGERCHCCGAAGD